MIDACFYAFPPWRLLNLTILHNNVIVLLEIFENKKFMR